MTELTHSLFLGSYILPHPLLKQRPRAEKITAAMDPSNRLVTFIIDIFRDAHSFNGQQLMTADKSQKIESAIQQKRRRIRRADFNINISESDH